MWGVLEFMCAECLYVVCVVSVCLWWVCLCVWCVCECGCVVCVWFVVGVVRLCGLCVWFVCVCGVSGCGVWV